MKKALPIILILMVLGGAGVFGYTQFVAEDLEPCSEFVPDENPSDAKYTFTNAEGEKIAVLPMEDFTIGVDEIDIESSEDLINDLVEEINVLNQGAEGTFTVDEECEDANGDKKDLSGIEYEVDPSKGKYVDYVEAEFNKILENYPGFELEVN